MNIVFFSTNSNIFNQNSMTIRTFPCCREQWKAFAENHPEHNFTILVEKPGMFLLDYDDLNSEDSEIKICGNLTVSFILPENDSVDEITRKILSFNPNKVSSITYWTNPFDWLSIKDGLIAEKLNENKIECTSHPSESCMICFDKIQTSLFLKNHGYNAANGVPVHHELFYAERNHLDVKTNVYKEYVFEKISRLKLPVVVKDTTGLSSFGMDVCNTFPEVKHVLTGKKNNGDRLVEEFLEGPSFGAEIYGKNGNYVVSPVLINSVNQFGLTSPKQNVKLGPVVSEKFKINELEETLIKLAGDLNLSGIAQVDLVFSDNRWYIIEINSRISGMTETISQSLNLPLYELIYMATVDFENSFEKLKKLCSKPKSVMNMKFPLLNEEKLKKLYEKDFIACVNQIENHNAKQLREAGYSEVIFSDSVSMKNLFKNLEIIKKEFPDEIVEVFYNNARKLYSTIE